MEEKENSSCFTALGIMAKPHYYLENGEYRGVLKNLLDVLEEREGICFSGKTILGKPVGIYDPVNDTYTGVYGELIKPGGELAAFPSVRFGETFERFFDASDYYNLDALSVAYKYPKVEPDMLGFVKPFSYIVFEGQAFAAWMASSVADWVWSLIIFSLIIVLLCLFVTLKATGGKENETSEPFYKAAISTWGIAMCQAIETPSNIVQKVLFGLWIVASFFLVMAYKCNLSAALIIPKINIPFRNIPEMVNQDKMGWAVVSGARLHKVAMSDPEDTVFGKLGKGITKLVIRPEDVVYGLETGEYAFVLSESMVIPYVVSTYLERGYCVATMIEERYWVNPQRIIFKEGSTLPAKFNHIMKYLREAGILDFWTKNEFKDGLQCIGNIGKAEKNTLRPLGLTDLSGILLIHICGLCLAAIIFFLEIAVSKFKRR